LGTRSRTGETAGFQANLNRGVDFIWGDGHKPGIDSFIRKSHYSHMKKASITEVKNNLSALIDGVKQGAPLLIMDRGRPVARLDAVRDSAAEGDGRLARLLRDGVIRPSRGTLPKTILRTKPPLARKGVSIVKALLDERLDGR
jgi:prevent-host-death family protein